MAALSGPSAENVSQIVLFSVESKLLSFLGKSWLKFLSCASRWEKKYMVRLSVTLSIKQRHMSGAGAKLALIGPYLQGKVHFCDQDNSPSIAQG